MAELERQKRGFLHVDFKVFHLNDSDAPKVEYHYHEFDKLVLLISGDVTYNIEGVAYQLKPGDLLFVPHSVIHKPIIEPSENYERYVIWTMPDFLSRHGTPDAPLSLCFDLAGGKNGFIRHLDSNEMLRLLDQLLRIREAEVSDEYLAPLMTESLFVQFFIMVCRLSLSQSTGDLAPPPDSKISDMMAYIENNLAGDLSVDRLSSIFYISRYHLMRRFKQESGYTLHQYITRRRILRAAALISEGAGVSRAAEACGYEDYSAFLRAFKSILKVNPRSFATQGGKADIYNE